MSGVTQQLVYKGSSAASTHKLVLVRSQDGNELK